MNIYNREHALSLSKVLIDRVAVHLTIPANLPIISGKAELVLALVPVLSRSRGVVFSELMEREKAVNSTQ